ncbi:hypothetical protein LXA43DRAFT_483464 [Ganoderma leucocontextum]|nr:hypothetical protein LXA43DRAFT_483464 [Ganoderma leucocontextum]
MDTPVFATYVFLGDIPSSYPSYAFTGSRRFRRAWTLQELSAPGIVLFFAHDWTLLGSKHTLSSNMVSITGIDYQVLASLKTVDDVPMAQPLAWASRARVEDEAYSILGVNMQITYGEAREAFFRLQTEALRRYPDQTLLAWGLETPLSFISRPPSLDTRGDSLVLAR